MQFLRIVGLILLACVGYGIVHDLVTVRVSLEYFTIGHPPIFKTESPTVLAIGWGILATWWVGLPLGFLIAAAARNGRRHAPISARRLAPMAARLLAVMAGAALLAGIVGHYLASSGILDLPEPLAVRIPKDRHARYLAAWCAHGTSYASGLIGGLVLVGVVWRLRTRRPR